MIRGRIRPLAAAVAAAVLVIAATPAEAGKSIKSKVTIDRLSERGASGKVKSQKAKCERRRTVILLFEDDYPGAQRIGKTKTNRAGRWKLDKRLDNRFGYYLAKVKRSELRTGKVCKADESQLRKLRAG
jgi:hypothetical protein